ncbi:MAG: beta-propeller fold lactonase family protein [Sphingomonadales bacterium]|nr:beta-propeller fold lactonase family protein [Sphingomonadales bacterium]
MTGSRAMFYVSCGGTQEIVGYRFDAASGALAECMRVRLPGAPAETGLPPSSLPGLRSTGAPLAVHPDGRTLYAVTRTEPPQVISYRIDADGGLAEVGAAAALAGTPYVATDRAGRWLLGAAYHENSGWVSAIGPDGAVSQAPVQVVPGLTTAHCVLVHPGNRAAYVSATGVPAVQVFTLGGEPPLQGQRGAAVAGADATPRHMALHPSARWLAVMNESSSVVDLFTVSADGLELAPVHAADLRPEGRRGEHGLGADLVWSADGRFLYACERRRGTVAVLAIDVDAGLLAVEQVVEVGRIPRSLALSPDGRFLATAVQGDGLVRLHAVAVDGSLAEAGQVSTGGAPVWVAFVSP